MSARPLVMWDLFSGLGGASAAMLERGWEVVRVDREARFAPTLCADIGAFPGVAWHTLPRPDLVWASPPCEDFSREYMPWSRTGVPPDLSLCWAALRVIAQAAPRWWILENVTGAQRWLGRAPLHVGPFYLWGYFPPFRVRAGVAPFRTKQNRSSTAEAERARVPYALSLAIAEAIESAASAPPREPRVYALNGDER